jgi:hypothetical protein
MAEKSRKRRVQSEREFLIRWEFREHREWQDLFSKLNRNSSQATTIHRNLERGKTSFRLSLLGNFPLKRNLGERSSAFEANLFSSRCNKSAKLAHPLCSNFLDLRSERCQQSSQGLPCGCEPPTQRRTIPFHQFTFAGLSAECANFRQLNNDTAWEAILCRIAHMGVSPRQTVRLGTDASSAPRSRDASVVELSNSDQLFVCVALIMVLETSTFSLSFRPLS